MKLLVFLILISIAAFQLVARGAETNSDYAVESESAQGTDTAPATSDKSALAKDASEILARMTDFISVVPAFTTFTFSPPEGAERIHFFADMPGEESK